MITIFTPTYNRRKLLPRLFTSLMNQSNHDFEWLVIDDCSTDGTKQYILSLSDAPFPIRYYKTEVNSGKHYAYNVAIEKAVGEYFICVDSDDYLSSDAISTIYESNKDNTKCVGYIYPQIHNKSIDNDNWAKIDHKLIDVIDTGKIYKIRETAIVIKKTILQKHRFPMDLSLIGVEKYCPETVLYNSFIADGKFMAINKGFYISEYQEDGLSSNIYITWLNNPNYFLKDLKIRFQVYNKYHGLRKWMYKSMCIVELNAFCWKKKISILQNSPCLWYSILYLIPGILFSFKRYRSIQ